MSQRVVAVSIVGAAVLYAAVSMAAIAGSHHDFTTAGTGAIKDASITDTCSTCHVPHKPLQNVPLWGHALSAANYTLYNQNTDYGGGASKSAAYDASPATLANSPSAACLSCHDGTVNVILTNKITNAMAYIMWDANAAVGGPGSPTAGLKGSHPVGVDYVAVRTADGAGYKDPTTFTTVKIIGSGVVKKVQCTSCHDPHNKFAKMLIGTNANSALCIQCHNK